MPPTLVPGLRPLRIAAGLSQQRLADAAGVRQATVSDLERGAGATFRRDAIERIARALGVEPRALFCPPT